MLFFIMLADLTKGRLTGDKQLIKIKGKIGEHAK